MRLELKVSSNFPQRFQSEINDAPAENFILTNLDNLIGRGWRGKPPSCYIERSFISSNGAKIIHAVCHLDAYEAQAMLPEAIVDLPHRIGTMLNDLMEFCIEDNILCEVWIDLLISEVLGTAIKYDFVKRDRPSRISWQEMQDWVRRLPRV